MRKHLLFISVLSFFVYSASAQITFQKSYGTSGTDFISDVQITADSGYIMAGYTNGAGAGGNDGFIVKANANGDSIWSYTYGCAGDDRINSVKQTSDNGYILSGSTTSFGNGSSDIYLIKTDSVGTPVWQKTFGGDKNDGGGEVRQASDGGYIVVGTTDSVNNASALKGVYIIRTDANGDSLWTRIFDGPDSTNINSGGSICPTHDKGYIIAGSAVQKDSSNSDVYLLKVDSSGHFLWDKFIGGPGNDAASAVHETKDKGFIITGTTNSFGNGGDDFYMVKTDSMGAVVWSKTYGGGTTDEGGYGDQTADGGYFIIGEAGSFGPGTKSYLLVKTNANGDTMWTKTYAASTDLNLGITGKQTADGGFILGGWHAVFHVSGVDYYLIKTDSSGNSGPNVQTDHNAETTPLSSQISLATTEGSGGIVTVITTPGGETTAIHGYCPITTDVNPIIENEAISIFPNPASDKLTIKNAELRIEKQSVYIINMLGQTIYQSMQSEQEYAIDVSSLQSGVYFIRISDEKATWTGKFIKE